MLFLIIFAVSCNSKNEKSKITQTNLVQNNTENKAETVSQQLHFGIAEVSAKLQKQEELTEVDYNCICNFLFNNRDESMSEEIGYQLFEYLKGNKLNNNNLLIYLDKKDSALKEKVLKSLIEVMCIDIGEENYSYEIFIKDFAVFTDSVSAKIAFYECMSNQ